jgi:phosphate transport system substrate-binding protein
MKTKSLLLTLGLAFLALHAQADRLVIKGSDTLGAKLVPQLAEQFKADRHVQPARETGGSRDCFQQRH